MGEDVSTNTTINELAKNNIVMIGEYYYLKAKEAVGHLVFGSDAASRDEFSDGEEEEKDTGKKTKPKHKSKTKSKSKPLNSSLKLKLQNVEQNLDSKLGLLRTMLESGPETKTYSELMHTLNVIEYRVLVLMKIIRYYLGLKRIGEDGMGEVEELVLGAKKVLRLLKDIRENKDGAYSNYFKKICNIPEFEIGICAQLIEDLETVISALSTKYQIKLYDVANTRPKLIFDTKYDETILNMRLRPYDSQIELVTLVKNYIQSGFMILYKTLPGLGKTSMILAICSYIRKSNSDLKVIFCCSDLLESVRVHVLRLAYNFGIRFGIATGSAKTEEYRIVNSWNCAKDADRELVVADYKSTYLILAESEGKSHDQKQGGNKGVENVGKPKKPTTRYLLFFDEPTVLTDQAANTSTLGYLAKIFYHIPSHTILSSATLPSIHELQPLITQY